MRLMLRCSSPLVYVLIIALLTMSLPKGPAQAAIVPTESVINVTQDSQADRARVRAFLARPEVQTQMQAYGISPEEAVARVDALTDREITLVAGELDRLPAGGYGDPGTAVAGIVLLLALVVVGVIKGIAWVFKQLIGAQEQKAEAPKVEEQKAE